MAEVQTSTQGYKRIFGYKQYLPRLRWQRKRALLDYLPQPVLDKLNGAQINRFSNSGIAVSWARVLNELGYVVDVVDWQDKKFRPETGYDLVVFHGGKNFTNIYPKRIGDPAVIYFSSGSYWKFNNQAEDARIKDFERRHKTKAARDRYIFDSEEAVNRAADGIIVLGDSSMKDTYPKRFKVLTINNASFPDDHFDSITKDYSKVRKCFLFFAGSGNIHKGLDLLIDAFKDLDEHLYIVTVPDKDVLKVFKKELKLPNIHLVGQVNMRDPKFYEVMDKCAFVILPSCSEGMAGSVVEAMNQGLIPIVSKETRLDARKYGLVLKDNQIETIKKAVSQMSTLEMEKVEKMAKRARGVAQKNHSPEKFRRDLRKQIREILNT